MAPYACHTDRTLPIVQYFTKRYHWAIDSMHHILTVAARYFRARVSLRSAEPVAVIGTVSLRCPVFYWVPSYGAPEDQPANLLALLALRAPGRVFGTRAGRRIGSGRQAGNAWQQWSRQVNRWAILASQLQQSCGRETARRSQRPAGQLAPSVGPKSTPADAATGVEQGMG